jgi:hypothetical protein
MHSLVTAGYTGFYNTNEFYITKSNLKGTC